MQIRIGDKINIGAADKGLVGEWVDDPSELGDKVKLSRPPTVEKICNCSDDEEDEADLNFEQIIEYMKSHNSMKYYGLLDEDFVPHVDAFWYGLEALCECIDHHISYDCNYDGIYVEDAEKARILRFIGSNAFEVTNYRIESALELRDRFEMKLSPKTKMSCNIK